MGRHEKTDNPQSQPDKDQGDQGGGGNTANEPWKDWGTDEEVRGDRGSGSEQR
jgi:hypothetical protein